MFSVNDAMKCSVAKCISSSEMHFSTLHGQGLRAENLYLCFFPSVQVKERSIICFAQFFFLDAYSYTEKGMLQNSVVPYIRSSDFIKYTE